MFTVIFQLLASYFLLPTSFFLLPALFFSFLLLLSSSWMVLWREQRQKKYNKKKLDLVVLNLLKSEEPFQIMDQNKYDFLFETAHTTG